MADNRKQRSTEITTQLFGQEGTPEVPKETDPELHNIMNNLAYGELFDVGNLDEQTRELISIVVLTTLQATEQLTVHVSAALRIGVTAEKIREAVYQCAPFIGFSRTLTAIEAMNHTFTSAGIPLPLPPAGTVDEEHRYEAGYAIQYPIYGDEIAESLEGVPDEFRTVIPRILTEFCFGDFYTRNGLTSAERELLVLCMLVTLGEETQILAHTRGNLALGTPAETLYAALLHCIPHIGFAAAVNAVRSVRDVVQQQDAQQQGSPST